MSMLTSLAEKGLIDNCLYCFKIFLFFLRNLKHFEIKENSVSGLKLADCSPRCRLQAGSYFSSEIESVGREHALGASSKAARNKGSPFYH